MRVTTVSRWFLAAHFGSDAGSQIFPLRGLHTANVGSSRDISLDAATGSVRRWCAVHLGDSTCLLMFRVPSRYSLLGNSNVEFHSHCAAGLRREAHEASCQSARVRVSLLFVD